MIRRVAAVSGMNPVSHAKRQLRKSQGSTQQTPSFVGGVCQYPGIRNRDCLRIWNVSLLASLAESRSATHSPGLRLALTLEIECRRSTNEIFQRRHLDLVAFVNVNRAPDFPLEAGVE
jgi:hypothetical protein